MRSLEVVLLVALTLCPVVAQELVWEVPGPLVSSKRWLNLSEFSDFDGDGVRDVLVRYIDNPATNYHSSIEIRSGRTGEVLWGVLLASPIDVRDAGDVDGDGNPDVLLLVGGQPRSVTIVSTQSRQPMWGSGADGQPLVAFGSAGHGYGDVLVANINLNGDNRQDFLVGTVNANHSTLYAHDHNGTLLWSVDHRAQGRYLCSAARYGDFNGDGIDDFLLGLQGDPQGRGIVAICSGVDGSYLRQSLGIQPGNFMCDHVRNVGDIDGDGVHDYLGFPAWFTFTADCAIFSGATGGVIRTWVDWAESLVGGPGFDLDRDGVPDLLVCNGQLISPNTYGQARAISGRDGEVLWNIDAQPYVPGGASPGYYGWGRFSASLGKWPGRAYPCLAWMELDYYLNGNQPGRVRAFASEHVGQSVVIGEPCSSTPDLPLIGVRKTATGARVTLARAPAGAFAVLAMSLQDLASFGPHQLPLDLAPLGMAGCQLRVLPHVTHWRITGTGPGHDRGFASVDLPFSLSAAATGTKVYAQWLALEPLQLDYAATEMHVVRGQ